MKSPLSAALGALTLASSLPAFADNTFVEFYENGWSRAEISSAAGEIQLLFGPATTSALNILGPEYSAAWGPSAARSLGFDGRKLHREETLGGSLDSDVYKSRSLAFGVAYGFHDAVEVGVAVPFSLRPGDVGNIPLWATFDFSDPELSDFRIGLRVGAHIPTNADWQIQAGLPFAMALDAGRIDGGVFTHFRLEEDLLTMIDIPLRAGVLIYPGLLAGVESGIIVANQTGNTSIAVPFFFHAGIASAGQSGAVDMTMRIGWHSLIHTHEWKDKAIDFRDFSIGVGLNVRVR